MSVALAAVLVIPVMVLATIFAIAYAGKHRHVWSVLSQEEQPAPGELTPGKPRVEGALGFEFMRTFYVRPVIVKRKCDVCGTEEVVRV